MKLYSNIHEYMTIYNIYIYYIYIYIMYVCKYIHLYYIYSIFVYSTSYVYMTKYVTLCMINNHVYLAPISLNTGRWRTLNVAFHRLRTGAVGLPVFFGGFCLTWDETSERCVCVCVCVFDMPPSKNSRMSPEKGPS